MQRKQRETGKAERGSRGRKSEIREREEAEGGRDREGTGGKERESSREGERVFFGRKECTASIWFGDNRYIL